MNEFQKAKKHFKKNDRRLFKALTSLSAESQKSIEQKLSRRRPTSRLFEDICWTIIGQQLSGKAANTIFSRFKKLCKKVDPKAVASKSLDDFRKVGISYAKGRALHDFSLKVQEGTVTISAFDRMANDEISQMLIQVRGIGPWTSEMTLMFSLGRSDIFSYGDLGLQKGIQSIYKLKTRPSRLQMESLSKKWSPYRTYAALTLWRHLDTKKKKTP